MGNSFRNGLVKVLYNEMRKHEYTPGERKCIDNYAKEIYYLSLNPFPCGFCTFIRSENC
jgi:hypothetical protein